MRIFTTVRLGRAAMRTSGSLTLPLTYMSYEGGCYNYIDHGSCVGLHSWQFHSSSALLTTSGFVGKVEVSHNVQTTTAEPQRSLLDASCTREAQLGYGAVTNFLPWGSLISRLAGDRLGMVEMCMLEPLIFMNLSTMLPRPTSSGSKGRKIHLDFTIKV